jgi:hypothetical protein
LDETGKFNYLPTVLPLIKCQLNKFSLEQTHLGAVKFVSPLNAISYIQFLSFFFLLKEKRNKKVQGKPDRSARFAKPAPPHCLRCILIAESIVGLTIVQVRSDRYSTVCGVAFGIGR